MPGKPINIHQVRLDALKASLAREHSSPMFLRSDPRDWETKWRASKAMREYFESKGIEFQDVPLATATLADYEGTLQTLHVPLTPTKSDAAR